MRKSLILAAVLLFTMVAGTALRAQSTDSFSPADNGKGLVNPGMGWMLYYYSNALDIYGSKLNPEDTVIIELVMFNEVSTGAWTRFQCWFNDC